MQQQWTHVAVAPGDDVVCRHGDVVLVGRADHPGEELLRRMASLVRGGAEGRDVVRAIAAAALGAPAHEVPSFGLVALTEDGPTVLLRGAASAKWQQDGEEGGLRGTEASMFAERLLPASVTAVDLYLPGSDAPDDITDLVDGVVRGSGVRVQLAPVDGHAAPTLTTPVVDPGPDDPQPSSSSAVTAPVVESQTDEPPAAEVEPAPHVVPVDDDPGPAPQFEVFGLHATDPEPEVQPTASDDVADGHQSPASEAQPARRSVMVEGIHCSRGHFNNPRALYCSLCGIAMVHQTHRPVDDVRPPLGVLVTDDGAVFSLNGDFVIGREPETAPEVQRGAATPLQLEDPALSMSRVHLYVRLMDWDVFLEDAGSANGTFVTVEGEQRQLAARHPTQVAPGTLITIGGRTVSFESHQRG